MNTLYALVESYNEATHDTDSLTVVNAAKERVTLRVDKGTVIGLRTLYAFDVEPMTYKDKDQWKVVSFTLFEDVKLDIPTRLTILKDFYPTTPEDPTALVAKIETALQSLENPVIKAITQALYDEHKEAFYLYPAATKFHHAFIGGVAHHTASMLKLAEGFMQVYPYLNRDLLVAGILLHDLFKTEELSDYKHPEYGPVGRLIGHITLGTQAIYHTAKTLGVFDTEERILLEHMVLSHHYYGSFGSPKKPNLPEALALHYIDNIDSKFVVLGEALEGIEEGTFTAPLAILDRERFYKAKR